jgi:lysophospholipase L1-like esterase
MKKIMFCFLVTILVINVIACSNTPEERDSTTKFENSMFIGDSITEGFAFNEILSKESVLAGPGATAGFTYDDIDVLVEKKPDNIFIMLGSCDILMPVDNPKELFRSDLNRLIDRLKEELPDSKIYLQSITPVTDDAVEKEARYEEIGEYNKILMELADELSVSYVDIGALALENPDLYAEDGIHFKKEFYQLWLEYLSKLI